MKNLYWRPGKVSRAVLVVVAALSLAGVVATERLRVRRKQPHHADKLAASGLALVGLQTLKAERLRLGLPINSDVDPMESGLIGLPITSVTSNTGVLEAKQTSVNPNFAGVVLHMLRLARVKPGQRVALGVSGSFPAVNVAVYAAVRQLRLMPVIITSASGSQFGANLPDFTWLEMEAGLRRQGVFTYRSVAGSLGGIQDRAVGMSAEGIKRLTAVIARHGLRFIKPSSLSDSIDQRMRIYDEVAGQSGTYAAYINIGGGTASVGTTLGKHLFKPGLNRVQPRGSGVPDSVMLRFVRNGVPVIHLSNIAALAKRHGLTIKPRFMPKVGEGQIYFREEYNRWLAAMALVVILATLFAFVRSDWGARLFRVDKVEKGEESKPQQMV